MDKIKKQLHNLIKRNAFRRLLSLLVAFVVLFCDLPLPVGTTDKRGAVQPAEITVKAADTSLDDDPVFKHKSDSDNSITVKVEDFVAYSQACAKYHKYHQNDQITISGTSGDTTYFQSGFAGLGTYDFPFHGSLKIGNNADITLNLDAPLFNYVYDDVILNNGNVINIAREYDSERTDILHSTAIVAQHVLASGTDGAVWKVNVTKPSDDADDRSYPLEEFGGMISVMEEGASLTLKVAMNKADGDSNPAVIIGSGDLGFACGTMRQNSCLKFFLDPDIEADNDNTVSGNDTVSGNENDNESNDQADREARLIGSISTGSGNVGGLVGSIYEGAAFSYTGVNDQDQGSVIETANGYAGGIVGHYKKGSVTISLPEGAEITAYPIKQYISGTNGAGGVYGYYAPEKATVIDTGSYDIDCQVNGKGYTGGLFGMLDTAFNVSISGSRSVKSNHASGGAVSYGGLIGNYKSDTIAQSLTIGEVSVETHKTGGSATYYGGGIGQIDATGMSYVKYDGFSLNKAYNAGSLTFGGLVGSADNAFIDAVNVTVAVNDTFKGGAMVGSTSGGILRMQGYTTITNAKSATPGSGEENAVGQLVGYRNSALVFAESGWVFNRSNSAVSVDDIGAWGEVIRFDGKEQNTVDSVMITTEKIGTESIITVNEGTHVVTVDVPSTGSYTTIGSNGDFIKTALNYQFDETGFISFALAHEDISNATISIASDIDLSGTGITGLTRDNAIDSDVSKCVFGGTISGSAHKITLAIGEPYGSGITSHDKEGRGKNYRHVYNGLIGIAESAVFTGIKFSGNIDISAQRKLYIGSAAACAKGSLTVSNCETVQYIAANGETAESGLKITVDGGSTVYSGRLVGCATDEIQGITVSNSIFDGKLTGANGESASCMGGVIGAIMHAQNEVREWSFDTVTIKGEVSNTNQKDKQQIGGLIAAISGYDSSGDVRKVTLNGVTINGLVVSGSVENDGAQGGLLGYEWLNTNVDVTAVTLSNNPSVVMAGAGNTAGLVYRGTGYWKITSLTMSGVDLVAPKAKSLGMIVNKGIAPDRSSAIYLELPLGYSYAVSFGGSTSLPAARSAYVFDELCAYSAVSQSDIMTNGNGVVSVSTSGIKMEKNNGNWQSSLTYVPRTVQGETANPNTRYYYNLDKISEGADITTDAWKLMSWAVRRYACRNIEDCFKNPGFTDVIPDTTYDLKGYSWYPMVLDSDVKLQGTFKLYNKEFELCEALSNAVWSSLTEDSAATQHYMLHNGLFYNMSGNRTLNVKNVTLQGNVGKMSEGSGFLISGTAQGASATEKAAVNVDGLILDGAYIHDISADETYAPLAINKVGSYATLTVKNVRSRTETAKPYQSAASNTCPGMAFFTVSGIDYPKAASSLIGNVGLNTSATGLTVEFSDIRLDGRTEAVENGNHYNDELDDAYGTKLSVFTKATLLNQFQYESGSNGKYEYTWQEDWKDAGGYTHSTLGVTYGKEIGYTETTHADTEYPGKEQQYKGEGVRFTDPVNGNATSGSYATNFVNGFLPYVAVGYNSTNKTHQLMVNHGATVLDGCGTYNDPYIISSADDLKTMADIINGTSYGDIVILPSVSSGALLATDWHDWHEGNHKTYKYNNDTKKYQAGTVSGNDFIFAEPADVCEVNTVRQYLVQAYYKLKNAIVIDGGFVGLGSTRGDTENSADTTGKYYFRGVIEGAGFDITNRSDSPLIRYSNGSVVRNTNLIVNNSSISVTSVVGDASSAPSFPSAKSSYGAVIGEVLGGDNIIDGVTVKFENTEITLSGAHAQLCPVGGYVGVVEGGGVIFRGMDDKSSTDIQGLPEGVVTVGETPGTSNGEMTNSDNKRWLYVNPIIGRVINGFAVTESTAYRPFEDGTRVYHGGARTLENGQEDTTGLEYETHDEGGNKSVGVTMRNGTKNYSITDIDKNLAKLNTNGTNGVVEVPNGQAFFIMSLIVNSGMSHKTLGYNQNYMISRWANYNKVGITDGTETEDYNKAHGDSKDNRGYLMHAYTDGETDISGYKIDNSNNNTKKIELTNNGGVYTLPDGYKGIGNLYQDSDNYRMAVTDFQGAGAKISLNSSLYYYFTDNGNGVLSEFDSTYSHHPDVGFGLFNYQIGATVGTANNVLSKYYNFVITGNIITDCIDSKSSDGSHVGYRGAKTGAGYAYTNKDCIDDQFMVSVGGLIGVSAKSQYLDRVALQNMYVHGIRYSGGLIGLNTAGSGDVFTYKNTKIGENTLESSQIRVKGASTCGGMIGKNQNAKIDIDNGNATYSITEVISECTKMEGDPYNYGVGGFIGVCRTENKGVIIKNITVGELNQKKPSVISAESAQINAGGMIGVVNRGLSDIGDCIVYNQSVKSQSGSGGLIGYYSTATKAVTITNVRIYAKDYKGEDSSAENPVISGGECSGGFLGDAKNDMNGLTISNSSVDGHYTITAATIAGGAVGRWQKSTLALENVEIADCIIQVTSNTAVCGGLVGKLADQSTANLSGYNILVNDISLKGGASQGSVCGEKTNGQQSIKIAGFSRQDDRAENENQMIDDLVGKRPQNTALYGTDGYVIFADYRGITSNEDRNKVLATYVVAKGNSTIDPTVEEASPYVTINPIWTIGTDQILTGDGVTSPAYNGSVYQSIMSDIEEEKTGRYTYTAALTSDEDELIQSKLLSSAKVFNNYKGLPNFQVLVVDDTDYETITPMINNYIRVLTNTNYNYAEDVTGVYSVGLHKCLWDAENKKFDVDTGVTSGCLKRESKTVSSGSGQFFVMNAGNVDTRSDGRPQITLMDIKFFDPSNSSAVAYHLYIPIYVKKVLQFKFIASLASNTDYYTAGYKYEENTLFENLGNPITLKAEYSYNRTADEWMGAINSGESVLTNNYKSLKLKFNQSKKWPDGTRLMLVDALNSDKAYYLDTPPDGNTFDLYTFKSVADDSEYAPAPLNRLFNVTVSSSEEGHLVLTDNNGTAESLTYNSISYPATVKGSDNKYYTYLEEVPDEMTAYNVTSVTDIQSEVYYLSIFTPKTTADKTIYHYEISSKESFEKRENGKYDLWYPNKVIDGLNQIVHLVIGDLYENELTVDVEPRESGKQVMSTQNNYLTVKMTANIRLTGNAKNAGVDDNMAEGLSNESSFIYQTFLMTYDTKKEKDGASEIGIAPDAAVSLGDKSYYLQGGRISAADFDTAHATSVSKPEYLTGSDSFIELRNNENLIRYLADSACGNAVTLQAKYDLVYAPTDLGIQFPKKDESTEDDIGAKVIGYSNISASAESAAYSSTSQKVEDETRYYTVEDATAKLNYLVVTTDDNIAGPYSYLGKNAVELGGDENAVASSVETYAVYDTRALKNQSDYVELTFELFRKNGGYQDALSLGTYLTNVKIYGAGDVVLYQQGISDEAQTTENVRVVTSGTKYTLRVKKDQLKNQADGVYIVPISYDVLTGDSIFNGSGLMYSNYKVKLTAAIYESLDGGSYATTSYATDHIIYTNARIATGVIRE